MPSRKSKKWQSRRKPSLGQLRRAHPASGATWNVQVVRGKMTSKCLWHACRALLLGMVLMLLGAGMATIGYYADQLSIGHEIRGNATVRVKNESRGFHLNNLSYVGPIVMGFGGFIVVAACVMTFEARDSAAKVVPARYKLSNSTRSNIKSNSSSANSARRANGIMHQATRWDHHLGVFRTSPAEPPIVPPPIDRQALTAALVHFSKTMGNSPRQSPKEHRFPRCGSVPNLLSPPNRRSSTNPVLLSHKLISNSNTTHHHRQHHCHNEHHHQQRIHHRHQGGNNNNSSSGRTLSKSKNCRISSSLINRTTRDTNNHLLHPGTLPKLHRHTLSDEAASYCRPSSSDFHSSLTSVAFLDSHESRIRSRTKRSDTARKHILSRQKPIEKEETYSPKLEERRRSSTASDVSCGSRNRRPSVASRTPSIDSKSVQVEMHSPERNIFSSRSPCRFMAVQSSSPCLERELRTQISVCSEPPTVIRQLSGQSSLEPCVLEESPEIEDIDLIEQNTNPTTKTLNNKKIRPESLALNNINHDFTKITQLNETNKLQRSNSSRTFKCNKKKSIINEYETVYFINTMKNEISMTNNIPSNNDNDYYDSVQVINERRGKLLKTESESALQISSLYLKNDTPIQSVIDLPKLNNSVILVHDNSNNKIELQSSKIIDKINIKIETEINEQSLP